MLSFFVLFLLEAVLPMSASFKLCTVKQVFPMHSPTSSQLGPDEEPLVQFSICVMLIRSSLMRPGVKRKQLYRAAFLSSSYFVIFPVLPRSPGFHVWFSGLERTHVQDCAGTGRGQVGGDKEGGDRDKKKAPGLGLSLLELQVHWRERKGLLLQSFWLLPFPIPGRGTTWWPGREGTEKRGGRRKHPCIFCTLSGA